MNPTTEPHKHLKKVVVIGQFTYRIDDDAIIYIDDFITKDRITYDTKVENILDYAKRFNEIHAIGINCCINTINSKK